MDDVRARYQILIDTLIERGTLKSPVIIKAFQEIYRGNFLLEKYLNEVDGDYPLPIGHGQTNSQPTTVAMMLELLEPKKGQKILDVGCGSGWTTALLADIIGRKGKVFGLEVVPELVKFGQNNLAKHNLPQAQIRQAAKKLGLENQAPFDRILVSAASEKLPQELVRQLKVGGIMIVPVINSIWKINKVFSTEIKRQEFSGFAFVPLI